MGKFYGELGDELSLHVRQQAWLNAVPRPEKRSITDKTEPKSRLRAMKDGGIVPALPPCSTPWIVEQLVEIGPVVAAGMGRAPIGWTDIAAWSAMTRTILPPWQARLLRRLSSDWLAESQAAEKPDAPPPWTEPDPDADRRTAISAKVGNAFRALLGSRGRRSS